MCGRSLPNDREHFKRTTVNQKDKLTCLCKECYTQLKLDTEWKDGKLLCHKCGQYVEKNKQNKEEADQMRKNSYDKYCR